MPPTIRRARGLLLRLARRRAVSVTVGVLLLAPAAWVHLLGASVPLWFEGVALILAATGAALAWTGLTGVRPDWVE
jgi:hypothetical protein